MSKKKLYYFHGVNFGEDRNIGFIRSDELIDGFNDNWIPDYQRGRIERTKKINSLINIFKTGDHIDAIKLNFIGEIEKEKGAMVLDGRFHVIDGQQRLWALQESEVRDYNMPVELYDNLTIEEEVKLFHRFNSDNTALTFGEMARSFRGPMAQLVQHQYKKKTLPVPLGVNTRVQGLTLSTFVPLMLWAHQKMTAGVTMESAASGTRLKNFLKDETITKRDVEICDFVLKNLLNEYIEIFGTYDHRSDAYGRVFFLAWQHVIINNFLLPTGKVDFHKFKTKIKLAPDLLKNAHIKSLTAASGNHRFLCEEIINFFNFKRKVNHIESTRDLKQQKKLEDMYG